MNFDEKGIAIYLQIADYMMEKALTIAWLPDEKVPSVREMAATLGVNPNTVQRAYEYLKQKEILYDKRGAGSFLNKNAVDIIKNYKISQFKNIDMPVFFKQMQLLDISMADIHKWHDEFIAD